jgi:hypothetical protein
MKNNNHVKIELVNLFLSDVFYYEYTNSQINE